MPVGGGGATVPGVGGSGGSAGGGSPPTGWPEPWHPGLAGRTWPVSGQSTSSGGPPVAPNTAVTLNVSLSLTASFGSLPNMEDVTTTIAVTPAPVESEAQENVQTDVTITQGGEPAQGDDLASRRYRR